MDNVPFPTKSSLAIYLESVKLYQWIFTTFGLNLPPALHCEILKPFQRNLMFISYAAYCGLLFAIAAYTTYRHNMMIQWATINYELDSITKIMSYMQNIALVLVQGCMALKTVLQHKHFLDILHLIEQLDYELLSEALLQRRLVKWKLSRLFGLWIIFLIIVLMGLNYFLIGGNRMASHFKVINSFFILAMQMKCVEYGIYMQLVYDLIDSVWQSLQIIKTKANRVNVSANGQHFMRMAEELLRNQQYLNRVWAVVNEINRYFAVPIFLIFYINGLLILGTANWAYLSSLYESDYLIQTFRLIYIIILLINLFIICSFSENCMKKYQSLATLLNYFKLQSHQSHEVGMRLREYSLQLVHHNLKFTCNNYLDIDFQNYGKMILIVIGYIVILVQFKMKDDSTGAMFATLKIFGKQF